MSYLRFWCPILGVFQVGFRWYGAIYLQLKSLSSMISKNLFLSYFFSPTWRSFTTAFLLLLPSWGFCLEDVEKNDQNQIIPTPNPQSQNGCHRYDAAKVWKESCFHPSILTGVCLSIDVYIYILSLYMCVCVIKSRYKKCANMWCPELLWGKPRSNHWPNSVLHLRRVSSQSFLCSLCFSLPWRQHQMATQQLAVVWQWLSVVCLVAFSLNSPVVVHG